ncbi:MAG TPA: hypothetical protein VH302_06575 [Bryobacteraceae bacterium]|nr:hypothetical protein [Bryobacteraceae bacterium]
MPCPFFEPQRALRPSTQSGGRLPLIDEYDGMCHATDSSVPAPDSARFRLCNHGNSKGLCVLFPGGEIRSCLRYEVTTNAEGKLSILCIEEQGYAPLRWYRVQYVPSEDRLDPAPEDLCIRAQALAFARSFVALTAKS